MFNAANAEKRDEDCLQLNVWTPGLDGARRPVLMWIHGGGFTGGTGATPTYDGEILSRRGDVVVVTINYRIGALGFLNLNEVTGGRIPSTGNEGLLDQVEALKWIHDNISAFGGDPATSPSWANRPARRVSAPCWRSPPQKGSSTGQCR